MRTGSRAADTLACAILVVRDEVQLVQRHIAYHLELGFDHIVILDHCSQDGTRDVLVECARDERLSLLFDDDPPFNHAALANQAMARAIDRFGPQWIFPLDADEFLVLRGGGGLRVFLREMNRLGIVYGSIQWLNALPESPLNAHRDPLACDSFYRPWPERSWQHDGHFRKAFCRTHANMEIVVGGHYFRWERNPPFFESSGFKPNKIPLNLARLCHFETRGGGAPLFHKWRLLDYIHEPQSPPDAAWLERIEAMKRRHADYTSDSLPRVDGHRTLWGNLISPDRIIKEATVAVWNTAHFDAPVDSHLNIEGA